MERIPKGPEMSEDRPMSTLAKTALSLYSFASALYAGAIMRHGPHPSL